ncbi:MAG: acetyltransferase [Proteobacteria bacterium]|nr:acetyltransferase [Pseudomonadota bacterium]MBU1650501.1 acetyltransferase [Pseudomonadota bacterium]
MSGGRLLILGASGHGKVVGDCAMAVAGWDEIRYFDDRWPILSACGPWSVVGTGEAFFAEAGAGDQAFVAIGNVAARLAWLRRLKASGISIATVIHPRSVISPHAVIGEGGLVVAGAVVNIDAHLGLGCIINTAATVDHDCVLGDGVHVCPGAHLAGDVQVGESSWLGIGCAVRQGIRIGAGVTVGAGAVVVEDVPDGLTVVGVPARPFETKSGLDLKC